MVTSRSPRVHRPTVEGSEWRLPWWCVAAVGALSLAIATVITLVLASDTARFGPAVRDALSVARGGGPLPWYTAWVTALGVVGWFTAAATGVLAGVLARRLGRRAVGRALVLGGLVSAAMGADDLFMFHDGVLVEKGVPEGVTVGVLVAAAALWGLTHLRILLTGREATLLVLAGAWFAHSLIVEEIGGLFFHEEASKAAAILCWTLWFWARAAEEVRQVPVVPAPTRSVVSS